MGNVMAEAEIRNVKELTTGDFFDFEVLHDGAWRHAKISMNALLELRTDGQTDRQALDSNHERIARVAQRLADTTPPSEKIVVREPDL